MFLLTITQIPTVLTRNGISQAAEACKMIG